MRGGLGGPDSCSIRRRTPHLNAMQPNLVGEHAEHFSRTRGDMLTIASRLRHDVGAELCGILTSSDLLRDIQRPCPPEVDGLVSSIARCAENARRLIDRTAALIRASAEERPVPEEIEMLPIVQNVCIRLERERKRRSATIDHPDDWPRVRASPEWLALVWEELIANALAWGGEQPAITLGWERGDGLTRHWVEDGGPGLRGGREQDPFPAFENLHASQANPGLGLPLVRRLVELMGGAPGYDRRSGRARFSFLLPD